MRFDGFRLYSREGHRKIEQSRAFPARLRLTGRLSFVQPLRRFARQGRVAAPSVCFAVACILLAAAPTAPPCFRRWRRSSPLPLVGEPLAKRRGFTVCQGLSYKERWHCEAMTERLYKGQGAPQGAKIPLGESLRGGCPFFLSSRRKERQLLPGMSPTMMTKSLGLPFSSFHLPKPTR